MSALSKYKLVITEGPSKGGEFILDKKTIGLGRDPKNQIFLDSQSVSLFHARITVEPGGCSITNLGSIEGVKVNGKNVDSASLSPGDRLQAGNVKLKLEYGAKSAKAPSARTRAPGRKPKRKRGFFLPLKPSFIILFLLALLAALVMLNVRWLGMVINW